MSRTAPAGVVGAIGAIAAGATRTAGFVAVVASLTSLPAAASELDASAGTARELFAKTVQAYREVPGLEDTVRVVIRSGEETSTTRLDYALGTGRNVELRGSGLRVLSLDDSVVVTRDSVADKYLRAPLAGNLYETLRRIFGAAAPPPLPPVSMRHASDPELALQAALDHLGMGLVGPATFRDTGTVVSGRGRELHRIGLDGDGGTIELTVRPQSYFLTAIRIERFATDRAPAATIELTFDPRIVDRPEGLLAFDTAGRKRVERAEDLVMTRMEVGEMAPSLALSRLGGGPLGLAQLRGRVAILDFFSTRCEPCRERLATTQSLAAWARQEGLEAVFLAIDTLEEVTDERQARVIVADFLAAAELTLPTLLDWNHELAVTLGLEALPSLYLLAPSGHIAGFYDGDTRPSFEELQKQVLELAGAADTGR